MIRKTLCKKGLLALSILFSHTVMAQSSTTSADSAQLYFQKGMQEKQKGRKMEVLKKLEKSLTYLPGDKQITEELAAAYYDLRKYDKSFLTYQQLDQSGHGSAAVYKKLMDLAFNMRRFDEVLAYAGKLKHH